MIGRLRSLPAKLVLTLVILLLVNGALFLTAAVMLTRHHLQAIEQSLNRGLAARILSDGWLPAPEDTGHPVEMAFDQLMGINPTIEIYRIAADGRILAYSAPAGRVVRDHVSILPIVTFLRDDEPFPILGDDPRSTSGQKVFSAAPIGPATAPTGYLYVILGGETYQSIASMFENDYVLRLGLVVVVGAMGLTMVAGYVAFRLLTRRFRRLSTEMRRFRESDFRRGPEHNPLPPAKLRDEIDEAEAAFRQMCDLISRQIRMLETIDESRREMLANISHDLRTPLSTLRGFIETMLMKEASFDEETRRKYLELALNYAVILSGRIKELFELSTLDAAEVKLNMMPFSIAELAQDMAEKLSVEATRRDIRLVADIAKDAAYVLGDIGTIERVFEKLLENALRFTPAGGTIRLTIAQSESGVMIRVDDSGPGIATEQLPHIFDRFVQGKQVRGATGAGAGLGLAIARRIIDLHYGRIWAESGDGGASFIFVLPLAPG